MNNDDKAALEQELSTLGKRERTWKTRFKSFGCAHGKPDLPANTTSRIRLGRCLRSFDAS